MSQQFDDNTLLYYAQELKNCINSGNEAYAIQYANALAENLVCIEVQVVDVQPPPPPPQQAARTAYVHNVGMYPASTIQQGYGAPPQKYNPPPNQLNKFNVGTHAHTAGVYNGSNQQAINIPPNINATNLYSNPHQVNNPPPLASNNYQGQIINASPQMPISTIYQNVNSGLATNLNPNGGATPMYINPTNPNVAYRNPYNVGNPANNMLVNPNLPTVSNTNNYSNMYAPINPPPNQANYYNQYGNN